MSTITEMAGVDSRGYPVVTRAEAHALAHAARVLYNLVDRSRRDMYGADAKRARTSSIVAERAAVSREAITALLIAAKVHAESEQADAALEQV